MSLSYTEMLMKEYGCTEDEAKQTIAGWNSRKTAKDEMIEREEMEVD